MTDNKFYLILTEEEVEDRFFTKELAIKDAKQLALQEKKTIYFMECTKVFAVDCNVTETSFEETTVESSSVVLKFKIGDTVQYQFARYQEGVVTYVDSYKITIEVNEYEKITDDYRFFKLIERK